MKSLIRLSLISIICINVAACSNKKSATASTGTATNSPETAKPTPPASVSVPAPSGEGTVRLVVSFYSAGEGIDLKAKDEFELFLSTYPKKIAYEPTPWGREGEVDYCLALNELTGAEQADFVKKVNELINKPILIRITENSKGDHSKAATTTKTETYRLVVSFYSIGEGIDLKKKEAYENFLNNYTKKIAFEPTPWGREGEVDYYLKLNELSSAEQSDFVEKTKELVNKPKLVHVNENAKCVHKH